MAVRRGRLCVSMEDCTSLTFAPPLRVPSLRAQSATRPPSRRRPRGPRAVLPGHRPPASPSSPPSPPLPPTPQSSPSSSAPPTPPTPPAPPVAPPQSSRERAQPATPPPPEPPVPPPVVPTLWGATASGRAVRSFIAAASVLTAVAWPLVTNAPAPDLSEPSDTTVWDALYAAVNGPHFTVAMGMGVSALVQALTGFGFAIVSVGALTQLPWIANSSVFNAVQPVAATLGAITGWLLLLPDLKEVQWRQIAVLLIASTLTTPIGAALPEIIDPNVLIHVLGALITGYVLYALTGVRVPKQLGDTPAAWLLGMFAGALGGAFDITGPPLVVYAEAADWDTANGDFRRNVLTVISVNSTVVVLWDWLTGRLNDYYYAHFILYAIPTSVIGIIIGKFLADRMDASMFKKVVLATCMIMGVKLLLS